MADRLTPEERSENMRRIKSKDTSPEMIVRRLTHRMGYRFRLHRNDLPGKPDLVFPSRRKVIFVHGCFWHQHDNIGCKIGRIPKSRTGYWVPKMQRNIERDRINLQKLASMGWKYLVVWECETKNTELLAEKINRFLFGDQE